MRLSIVGTARGANVRRGRGHSRERGGRLAAIALLLVGISWILLMRGPGSNQNAHYALVKSVAHGSPTVDRYHNETPDVSFIDGHYYTAKAPGLALTVVPYYLALRGAGLIAPDRQSQLPYPEAMYRVPGPELWKLSILGAALPALVLLFLVRGVSERFTPRAGAAAAVLVGAGSLVGAFATLFFAHALSACLGFAAFAVLVRERTRPRWKLTLTSGLLAGLAVVAEFPLAIVAVGLAAFVLVSGDRVRRLAAFGAGVIVGLVPLATFNWWAFGSPFTLSYTNAVTVPGTSGHDVVGANASGFFGVGVPSLRAAVELLAASKGLLVLTPVWMLGVVGAVLLWRRGERATGALICYLACAFLGYNAGYYLPFGGFAGGPRFLVPLLPFLAVGVAAAADVVPLTTLTLGLASVVVTATALVVDPGLSSEDAGSWFHELERGQVTRTVFGWVGAANGIGVALALAAIVLAVGLGVLVARPGRVTRRDVLAALAALCLWRAVYVGAPILLEDGSPSWLGLFVACVLLLAVTACLVLASRLGPIGAAAGLPLLPLAWPAFAAHTSLAALAVVVAAAATTGVTLLFWTRVGLPEQPARV
jgi:hypothetical protein